MISSQRGSLDNSKSGVNGESVTKEVRETYLVILVLIAAAAYQTALSPPGGYWQEDKIASLQSNPASSPVPDYFNTTKNYTAGTSIIGTNKNEAGYSVFVICNSLAFYTAIYMIFTLTVEFPMLGVMQGLLVLLSANYTTCVVMVLPPDYGYLRIVCIAMPLVYLVLTIFMLLKRRSVLKYAFEF